MDAETFDCWFICLLLSDLSIKISDDDLHVMFWAAVVLPLQLRIEGLLVVIGTPKVRTVHIYNTLVKESATNSQPAHPLIDRPPPDYSLLHHTYRSGRSCSCYGTGAPSRLSSIPLEVLLFRNRRPRPHRTQFGFSHPMSGFCSSMSRASNRKSFFGACF